MLRHAHDLAGVRIDLVDRARPGVDGDDLVAQLASQHAHEPPGEQAATSVHGHRYEGIERVDHGQFRDEGCSTGRGLDADQSPATLRVYGNAVQGAIRGERDRVRPGSSGSVGPDLGDLAVGEVHAQQPVLAPRQWTREVRTRLGRAERCPRERDEDPERPESTHPTSRRLSPRWALVAVARRGLPRRRVRGGSRGRMRCRHGAWDCSIRRSTSSRSGSLLAASAITSRDRSAGPAGRPGPRR